MTQRHVETVIGRLATDEEVRRQFREAPERTLDSLARDGLTLSLVERDALARIDPSGLDAFAEALDPRVQKVALDRLAEGTADR